MSFPADEYYLRSHAARNEDHIGSSPRRPLVWKPVRRGRHLR